MFGEKVSTSERCLALLRLVCLLIKRCHSLAYAEMRTILARVIYNFDMKLAEDSQDWMEKQKIFLLWEKGPLNVYLTPAKRT